MQRELIMGVSRERKRKHKMDLIGEKQGYRSNLSFEELSRAGTLDDGKNKRLK